MCTNIVCECRRLHTLYATTYFDRDCSAIKIPFIEIIIEPKSLIIDLSKQFSLYFFLHIQQKFTQNKLYENRAETIRDG